jgi:hypothetical protein
MWEWGVRVVLTNQIFASTLSGEHTTGADPGAGRIADRDTTTHRYAVLPDRLGGLDIHEFSGNALALVRGADKVFVNAAIAARAAPCCS